jgi:flagellar basal body-associated protein FliL
MAWSDGSTFIIIIIILVVTLAVTMSMLMFFGMRLKGKKKTRVSDEKDKGKEAKSVLDLESSNLPFKMSKSVQTSTASSAKDELRILDLEREILGDSIRRLYEAQAEGKITESERDKLAVTYKNRMNIIKESIAKDETIVALHELEGMQEDLMQLFSERFGELTSKVEELRGRIDIKPIREIPVKMPTHIPIQMEQDDDDDEEEEAQVTSTSKSSSSGSNSSSGIDDRVKKKRKPSVEKLDVKSEAEKRIDSIRSEVEKVLDKLGQMEIEN